MTLGEATNLGQSSLHSAGIDSAHLDSLILLEHVTGKSRTFIIAHPEATLTSEHANDYQDLLKKRSQRVPLVHLTNTRSFYNLNFHITADVLTPRVETEQMVEWALKYAPRNSNFIDIGTGSGAIAAAIKYNRSDLHATATEVSTAALQVAKENFKSLNLDISLLESDLWEKVSGVYATVVTNLPYLKDEDRDNLMPEVKYEPDVALFGGRDGLDLYRRFLEGIPAHLSDNGYLFTECDPWQHDELIKEAEKYNLQPIEKGYFILGFQKKKAKG